MSLKDRYIRVDDVEIFYLEGEPVDGPLIVLVHGWGLSSHAFRMSLKLLNTRFRVIAPDLPRFGRSSGYSAFHSYEHYAQFLVHFLDALKIKKANLVGQSMGGAVCAVAAALYPERVESLVLANSAGVPLPGLQRMLLRRAVEISSQVVATGWKRQNFHLAYAFTHNVFKQRTDLLRSARMPIFGDIRPLLHKIKAPCLLAWGSRDVLFPLEVAKEFEERIPNCELYIVENGYHEWCIADPRKLLSIIELFYKKRGMVDSKAS